MRKTLPIIGLVVALAAGACTNTGSGKARTAARASTIPQPIVEGLSIAPDAKRVDLRAPTFSNPTKVTNPLFPIASQRSVLLLGTVDGQPFRTEVTLLPETRVIDWDGQRVETLVSQYVAFLGGRIHEVAYDFYAQDDNGSVWYFGEDVYNFADGAIVDTHGTWIAGKDGPAAMIMPAHPKVGDVYRPENIPGFVFEEVRVKAVDQTLDGPLGPIEGGLLISELHMDGTREDKSFAPGYGEFYTAGGGDVEALALAVPTDAASETMPAELGSLASGALEIFNTAGSKSWSKASATLSTITTAWDRHRGSGGVPRLVAPRMAAAIGALTKSVRARDIARARQSAIDVARSSFDLQLRYRPVNEIDVARFDLWGAQLLVDAAAKDSAAVYGDFFALDYVRDRIQRSLDASKVTRLNVQLEELLSAIGDEDFDAVGEAAVKLREILA